MSDIRDKIGRGRRILVRYRADAMARGCLSLQRVRIDFGAFGVH